MGLLEVMGLAAPELRGGEGRPTEWGRALGRTDRGSQAPALKQDVGQRDAAWTGCAPAAVEPGAYSGAHRVQGWTGGCSRQLALMPSP